MAFYDAIPASDGTSLAAPSKAEFKVFEVADTGRTNPLPLRTVAGTNAAPLVTTAQGVVPPVEVVSPNFEHIFKSGEWEWRRESSEGMRKAAEEARASALLVQQRVESGELKGGPGDKGDPGLPGVNAVPASEAVAAYANTPGNPVNVAIGAVAARQGAETVHHGREAATPRPRAGQVTWVGWVRPDNMETKDIWLEIAEPPFNIKTSIGWEALYLASDLTVADGAPVPTWADSSGRGHNLTPATSIGAGTPTLKKSSPDFNGQSAVAFNASAMWSEVLASPVSQPFTVIAVARGLTNPTGIFGGPAIIYRASASPGHYAFNPGNGAREITGSAGTDLKFLMVEFDGSSSTVRANKLTAFTGAAAGTVTHSTTQIKVGGHDAGASKQSEIALVGLYRGRLTDVQRSSLFAWITKQYGVAL